MTTLWPDGFFDRQDDRDDGDFYAAPRFVTHLDDPAVTAVGALYAQCFPSKAVRGWLGTDDQTHCAVVAEYHRQDGGFQEPVAEQRLDGRRSDPLWAVWARRLPPPG